MESTYTTPMKTPKKCSRRRALSPTPKSQTSSPYEVIDLELQDDELQSRVRDQDEIIQEQRATIKKMQEQMSDSLNDSIVVESSNTVSVSELRVHRRDISLLEQDLDQKKRLIRTLRHEIDEETRKRKAVEAESSSRAHELRNLQDQIRELTDALRDAEDKAAEQEKLVIELRQDNSSLRTNESCRISGLEARLSKYREEVKEERSRNSDLCKEVSNLKSALNDANNHLRKDLEDAIDRGEAMNRTQMETRRSYDVLEEGTKLTLLSEMKTLSTHLINIPRCVTPDPEVSRLAEQIGSLKSTIKYNEEKMSELAARETALCKTLDEAKSREASAELELDALRRRLVDVEGNQELASKYLAEETEKVKIQKAGIRYELLQLQREHEKLKTDYETMSQKMADTSVSSAALDRVRDELSQALSERARLERENDRLTAEIASLEAAAKEINHKLSTTRDELEVAVGEQGEKQALKLEITKLEEKLTARNATLVEIDSQCEQYRTRQRRSDAACRRAQEDVKRLTDQNRELERAVETQRASEAELAQLRVDKDRLVLKNRYLTEELQEVHSDYRDELAKMAREISDSKRRERDDKERPSVDPQQISTLRKEIENLEGVLRTSKRQVEELKQDNEKLQSQVKEILAREDSTMNENVALRQGLSDALAKLEQYKQDADNARDLNQEMAEQFSRGEEKIASLEDKIAEVEDLLKEKESLVAYLQSQINVKQLPKVSRRSTLLRIPSETSIMNESQMVDPGVVEELENERSKLLQQLEEKKKRLNERRDMPPPPSLPSHRSAVLPSAPPRTPLSEKHSNSESHVSMRPNPVAGTVPGVMRHDIPHRWKDLRNLGLFSIKCAVCFVGVSTFCKARRCSYCNVIVHTQCATRVVNTCGLPDECANFYLDSPTAPIGSMNGWIKMFSDCMGGREWMSAWGLMEENKLSFFDKDGAQGDLSKPILKIDLHKEQIVLRAGVDLPVQSEDTRHSASVIHIKMTSRNVYILAPSLASAKRWVEALQSAQTRRLMLTRKTSSFSDQSCLLVLPAPNNLTIHTTAIVDEFLVIGAQSGLFFTSTHSPRVPIRIGGLNSVSAMEVMPDVNMLALVTGAQRSLALLPLSTLKAQLTGMQPAIRPDVISGFDHLHLIMYHQQEGQRYLCVADTVKIHILKYNSSRDMFIAHHAIDTAEPAMCLQSSSNGFYFGADSFYFVEMGRGTPEVRPMAASHVADYPLAVLQISEDEVLLAYQNYGMFVNSRGQKTRENTVEWEQMPMEFVYTAPYLFVIHYDSIEIMQVAPFTDYKSATILEEREVFECQNAHIVGKRKNGDVFLTISNKESTEVHRFNATNQKRNPMKRKGLSLATFHDKRSKTLTS